MIATITTFLGTAADGGHLAADRLGRILGKHPESGVQSFDVPFGRAHVWYPEASAERCTAALVVDPALDRGRDRASWPESLRPTAAPFACTAIHALALPRVFRSAVRGHAPDGIALDRELWPLELCLRSLLVDVDARRWIEPAFAACGLGTCTLGEVATEGAWSLVDVRAEGYAAPTELLRQLTGLLPAFSLANAAIVGRDALAGCGERMGNAFAGRVAVWGGARYTALLGDAPVVLPGPSAADASKAARKQRVSFERRAFATIVEHAAADVLLVAQSLADTRQLAARLEREPGVRRVVAVGLDVEAAAAAAPEPVAWTRLDCGDARLAEADFAVAVYFDPPDDAVRRASDVAALEAIADRVLVAGSDSRPDVRGEAS